jgi:hypothetical protein
LKVGDAVDAGQFLRHHATNDTFTDVAVARYGVIGQDPGAVLCTRLVSYFDLLTDDAFAAFQVRGVVSRTGLLITAAQRDATPLTCNGQQFTKSETTEDWVMLTQ